MSRSFDLIEHGDLLAAPHVDYIVQQCNCLTLKAAGLAADIAARFPLRRTNPYVGRLPDTSSSSFSSSNRGNLASPQSRGNPGLSRWFETGAPARAPTIVCLMAQWRPGPVGGPTWADFPEFPTERETPALRLDWFKRALRDFRALLEMVALNDTEKILTVGFPYGIGCGLAGGDWSSYCPAIADFARQCPPNVRVKIFKRA